MISTKNDEENEHGILSLCSLVLILENMFMTGNDQQHYLKGLNYTTAEWLSINVTIQVLLSSPQQDISIQRLFELEEIEQKYRDHLFLAKLSV